MDLWRELRLAARALRAHPGITVPALLTIGLGVGATSAVFSVVDHVLFRPLDVPHADRVVTVCEDQQDGADYCTVATPNVVEWAAAGRTFEELGAARQWSYAYRGRAGLRTLDVAIAMPGFLRAVGMSAMTGRALHENDLPPHGDGRVVMLTHGFWVSELGGAADAIGRTILLDEEPYEIIGILPPDAVAPRIGPVTLWLPLPWDPARQDDRDWRGFVAAGRLAPGVSSAQAAADVRALYAAQTAAHPEALRGNRVAVMGMQERIVQNARPLLLLFLGAVTLVLLLICVNVASLLLARATARDREMAVRIALGARGPGLARQLLTETLLLAGIGGALGALVAVGCVEAFVALAPPGIPRIDEIVIDLRILLFALLVTAGTGALLGLVPLLRLRLVDAGQLFRTPGALTVRASLRPRQALVVLQVALALVLVASAGLLLRSFAALLAWNPGFDPARVLSFSVFPAQPQYPGSADVLALYRRAEEELSRIPGVASVSTASAGPLFGGGDGASRYLIEGAVDQDIGRAASAFWFDVGPAYFATLGLPLLRGRAFTERDVAGAARVAVINRTMAESAWPDADPVGARLVLPDHEMTVEVIGVVENVPPLPGAPAQPEIYFTNRQFTRWATFFILRTAGDPAGIVTHVRDALQRIDPDLDPGRMQTLQAGIDAELVRPRFNMALVGLFAVIALVLGGIGIYGLIAYMTEVRRQEIGIRLAIGASPQQILGWTLRIAGVLVLAGTAAGVIGALVFSRLLASVVFGVSPTDPLTFAVAVGLLGGCGFVAALRPALRASRVDPRLSMQSQ